MHLFSKDPLDKQTLAVDKSQGLAKYEGDPFRHKARDFDMTTSSDANIAELVTVLGQEYVGPSLYFALS